MGENPRGQGGTGKIHRDWLVIGTVYYIVSISGFGAVKCTRVTQDLQLYELLNGFFCDLCLNYDNL